MMDHTFQKTTQDEYDLFFRMEGEAAEQHGFLGYLRGDYGRSGREFWTTWFDSQADLKTDVFRVEFNAIIDYLRDASLNPIEGPDVFKFHCLQNMRRRVMDTEVRFKIVTEGYSYYFRCQPQVDDYHLYCMAFDNRFLLPEIQKLYALPRKCFSIHPETGERVTTHHIRVDKLTELVSNHLRNILHFANMYEDQFVKVVVDERYRDVCASQRRNQKEFTEAKARDKELDRLYEKIYEDQALGRLPEERFNQLAAKYDEEQAALRQRIRHLKKIVAEEQAHEMNLDGFLALVRRYSADFAEFTPDMVHEFIDKVVVHHRQKEQGKMMQRVEIYYKMIGHVDVPVLDKKQTERFQVSYGRIRDVVAIAA